MLFKVLLIFCALLCCAKAKVRCPKIKHSSPYNHVVEVGNIARLKCDFLRWDSSWSFSWYKDGKIIAGKKMYYGRVKSRFRQKRGAVSLLRIKPVWVQDSGIYECVARSRYCIVGKRLRLTVSGSSKFGGIKGEGAPWFTKLMPARQFIVWQAPYDITLRCPSDGEPPLKYQWLKDGKAVTYRRLDPKVDSTKWHLRIKTAVPSDNGLYKCIVSNRLGNISNDFKLVVQEKGPLRPVLSNRFPVNKTVRIGDNVTFQCIELFSPMLTDYRWLHWKKLPPSYPELNLAEIPSANSSYYTLINHRHYKAFDVEEKDGKYGGRVHINNVTKKDEGMYTCLITNSVGQGSRNAFLRVVDSEISKPLESDDETEKRGSRKMACSVLITTARPEFNRGKQYRNLTITLKSVRPDDANAYACNVSDRYDSINMTVMTSEQNGIERSKPILEDFRNVKAIKGESVSLTCKAFTMNRPKLIWFKFDKILKQYKLVLEGDRVKFEAVEDRSMGWYGERLRLLSVSSQDSTEYLCMGINIIGSNTQSLMVKVLPKKSEENIG
ncbi:fibroblast growth factor receptor 3-like [Dendronephthya gigantea]|uniref:fibroblast growth factor receptor 3-like n=1 Tax=Dendronephthya gigantea TaxID=151771 RepID=UPI00106B1BDB|nr:fibroblast growth factor receptor 3-like [Dendronephthya gigantea]XP_028416301.1 fibroblast growth factor receptor 3-like [Dendronephthya gigantea]XP_028416302.1 fibroblast growth factor receptor 3-like [Dendronephthya gigantea]